MSDTEAGKVPSGATSAAPDTATLQQANLLADLLETKVAAAGRRIDIDPERVQRGLGQLVLTVVKLLHVLLERQAIRRVDGGDLDEDEIEQLGLALMRQSEEIDRLRRLLGLEEQDLNLDLGPLGKLF
ncbi:MAG: gas vesicle protein K [Thiocapsa sp.]|uniref:gas vesicle protein K n=1 Tax=Thiocapsa sp. TaxID=2024551 RepID=UPI001BCBC9C9|nr:gas vesicle protein K [Thiocapsa sp.]QVL47588.1 MAG: gas vesicle protein K [Thiocapsa sp.]QVL49902.1 MAG: gas vesicle protein K [Thiocapsa sp.]